MLCNGTSKVDERVSLILRVPDWRGAQLPGGYTWLGHAHGLRFFL